MQNNISIYVASNKTSSIIVLPSMKCYFDGEKEVVAKYTRQRIRSPTVVKHQRKNVAQWLFFKESRWIPLDLINYDKLENTIRTRGRFIDIQDSHFPEVRRVRVFPELDYLSYLGIRYRISKVLLPS